VPQSDQPWITVIAGVNGAGKSSVVGAQVRHRGGEYFNPDEVAQALRADDPEMTQVEANGLAWRVELASLRRALDEGTGFAFETTLGGRTITSELLRAAEAGRKIRLWYVGLGSAQQHIDRVQERQARGGHGIPVAKIIERYRNSRQHLKILMPHLTEFLVYDNSGSMDPVTGVFPAPLLVVHAVDGTVRRVAGEEETPLWAREIREIALTIWGHSYE
jgi:predicted ABC-type ATPase